jgi:predicted DsbA family dithiol-disulfide isomerase
VIKQILIEIWSDFACPYCYIAQTRLARVIKALALKDAIEMTYKAYQLNPFAPVNIEDSATKVYAKKLGISIEDASIKLNALTLLGKEELITLDYAKVIMTNTFDAHRLTKISEDPFTVHKLHHGLMEAYFKNGKNLADVDTLISIATSVGLVPNQVKVYLEGNKKEEEVRNDMLEARSLGIRGVPYILINRRYTISGAQPFETFQSTLQKAIKD